MYAKLATKLSTIGLLSKVFSFCAPKPPPEALPLAAGSSWGSLLQMLTLRNYYSFILKLTSLLRIFGNVSYMTYILSRKPQREAEK